MTRIVHKDDPERVLFEDRFGNDIRTLRSAILQGVDLHGADLSAKDLSEAILNGASLAGADFQDAFLISTRLDRANLRGASFKGALLERAVFENADLSGADLSGARLQRSYLGGANLTGVRWDEATIFDGIEIDKDTKMDRGLVLHLGGHGETEKLLQELKHYLEEGRWDQARRVFRSIPGMYPPVKPKKDQEP